MLVHWILMKFNMDFHCVINEITTDMVAIAEDMEEKTE